MKRILALLLACALVANMGAVAWAEEKSFTGNDELEATATAEVYAITDEPPEPEPAYYVTVAWESMAFSFEGANAGIWNAGKHTYDGAVKGHWTGGGTDNNSDGSSSSKITITNHSNVEVTAACAYVSDNYKSGTPRNGVTVTFKGLVSTKLQAGDADNIAGIDGDNQTTAAVSVSGVPEETVTGTVGTVTITISS